MQAYQALYKMNKLAMMPIIKTIEGKNYWTNND